MFLVFVLAVAANKSVRDTIVICCQIIPFKSTFQVNPFVMLYFKVYYQKFVEMEKLGVFCNISAQHHLSVPAQFLRIMSTLCTEALHCLG